MALRILPDAGTLREMFDYDPESGEIRYRHRPRNYFSDEQSFKRWNTLFSGTVAKSQTRRGCIVLSIRGVTYLAHRVAFKIHHGIEPPLVLDHINRDPSDNRILNIRAATPSQNTMNSTIRSDTRTGVRGVSIWKDQFCAYVYVNGHQHWLGTFQTIEQASKIRELAARKLFGDFYC
jgi:hypothetical protein